MGKLPLAARVYVLAVIGAASGVVWLLALNQPWEPSLTLLTLCVVGAASGRGVIRLGDRVHLSASHPFILAALILEGPVAAVMVSAATTLGAQFFRGRLMTALQVAFNLAAMTVATAAGWLAWAPLTGGGELRSGQLLLPVLVTSLVFFLANSGLVSVVVGLASRESIVRAWCQKALWSGPSFLAGGVLGLILAQAIRLWGLKGMLLPLPLCYMVYYSYRLYMERLEEKKRRVEEVELLNAELESKVRERTDELSRLNEQLSCSNRGLTRANQHKSEFLANVTHELRTPLNVILGFTQLVAEGRAGAVTPLQQDHLGEVLKAGKGLKEQIDEILDLAKLDAGRLTLQIVKVEPVDEIEQVVSSVRELAEEKSIELSLELGSARGTIEADPVRLRQVLRNLLSNAIKFTPSGGRVGVELTRSERAVRIAIWDTGIGVDKQDIDRLFSDFFQVDGSTTRSHGGTGLGLALVKRLIDLHGGQVAVSSEINRGSRFELVLPNRLNPWQQQTGGHVVMPDTAIVDAGSAVVLSAADKPHREQS